MRKISISYDIFRVNESSKGQLACFDQYIQNYTVFFTNFLCKYLDRSHKIQSRYFCTKLYEKKNVKTVKVKNRHIFLYSFSIWMIFKAFLYRFISKITSYVTSSIYKIANDKYAGKSCFLLLFLYADTTLYVVCIFR